MHFAGSLDFIYISCCGDDYFDVVTVAVALGFFVIRGLWRSPSLLAWLRACGIVARWRSVPLLRAPLLASLPPGSASRAVRLRGSIVAPTVERTTLTGIRAVAHECAVVAPSGRLIDRARAAVDFWLALPDGTRVHVKAAEASAAGRLRLGGFDAERWQPPTRFGRKPPWLCESWLGPSDIVEVEGMLASEVDPAETAPSLRLPPTAWTLRASEDQNLSVYARRRGDGASS